MENVLPLRTVEVSLPGQYIIGEAENISTDDLRAMADKMDEEGIAYFNINVYSDSDADMEHCFYRYETDMEAAARLDRENENRQRAQEREEADDLKEFIRLSAKFKDKVKEE